MTVADRNDDELFAKFFALTTTGDLRDFVEALDPAEGTVEAAMVRYAATWPAFWSAADAAFDPGAHVSRDRTAALFGSSPCVFLGTNNWAVRATMSADAAQDCLLRIEHAITNVSREFAGRMVTLIVVPEKDFAIDHMFRHAKAYEGITAGLAELKASLSASGIGMIFLEPLNGLERYVSEADFAFPDTHLLPRMYLQYLGFSMLEMGYNWDAIHSHAVLRRQDEFLDLSDKLNSVATSPQPMMVPSFRQANISLVDGYESFQTPLRHTWQRLANSSPLIGANVLLLGDSHSSIASRGKLTGLYASIFRGCEFHWNPCGLNGNLPSTPSDHVVLEISQRFVFS
jgi:hypothetical protein